MSDGEDSHKDDVLVSLRRIMRGGRPAPEGGEAKRSGGLFGRRRSAEQEAEATPDAEPVATPDAETPPEPTAEAPVSEPPAADPEPAVAPNADAYDLTTSGDAPVDAPDEVKEETPEEPLADGELLALGDFMLEPIEESASPADAVAEETASTAEAPQLAEEALEASATEATEDLAMPELPDVPELATAPDEDAAEPSPEPFAGSIDAAEPEPEPEPEPALEGLAAEDEAPVFDEALAPEFPAEETVAAVDAVVDTAFDPTHLDEGAPEPDAAAPLPPHDDAVIDEPGEDPAPMPVDEAPFGGPVSDTPAEDPVEESAPAFDPAAAAAAALPAAAAVIPAAAPEAPAEETLPAATTEGTGGAVIMDESALEDMIRRVIRAELVEGDLGRNISANVRRLIEDEIARAMLNRSKD
ncbi:MAG: hypothetical protein AAFP17_18535 [Pseudomonadota bacterium]